MLNAIIAIETFFAIIGFYFGMHDFRLIISLSNVVQCGILDLTKVFRFTHKSHRVWNLITMVNIDIFKNCHYRKDIVELYKNKIAKYTTWYTAGWLIVMLLYLCGPIFIQSYPVKHGNGRITIYPFNVINLLYQPLSIECYKQFYAIFYILEAFFVVHSIIVCFILDNLMVLLGLTILAQLKTIESDLHTFGHQPTNHNGKFILRCSVYYTIGLSKSW